MWNSLIVIVSVSYSHDHLNSHEAAVPNLLSRQEFVEEKQSTSNGLSALGTD